MTSDVTIFVRLLDEGVQVWRPVAAMPRGRAIYLIVEQPYDPSPETWEFSPGDVVSCDEVDLGEGPVLVATGRITNR